MATIFTYSCHSNVSTLTTTTEFDIPTFIKSEASKLQALDPTITKTVCNSKSTRVKEVKISNWQNELAHFTTVDISKSGSTDFSKEKIGDTLIYSISPDSKTKIVAKIIFAADSPIAINIYKKNQNLLFGNEESLIYDRKAGYSISKRQSVKGMGENNYLIKGDF